MVKRILALMLIAVLAVTVVGCAGKGAAPTAPTTTHKTRPVWQTSEDTSCFPLRLCYKQGNGMTEIEIYPDGSFEGLYTDGTIATDKDTGISSGKMFHCKFNGEFATFVKRDAHSYTLTLRELRLQRPVGEEWSDNGVSYTAVEAYGLTDAKSFVLYLPNTPEELLPEEVKAVALMNETMPRTLAGYCLVTDKKTVFITPV